MKDGMIFYAHAHEFAMRSFAILGGMLMAYLLAVAVNAAWEWLTGRGGKRS